MILCCGHNSDKHEFGRGFYFSIYIMDNLLDFKTLNERICKIVAKLKYYNLILIANICSN